jgi:hypothetical protein
VLNLPSRWERDPIETARTGRGGGSVPASGRSDLDASAPEKSPGSLGEKISPAQVESMGEGREISSTRSMGKTPTEIPALARAFAEAGGILIVPAVDRGTAPYVISARAALPRETEFQLVLRAWRHADARGPSHRKSTQSP